MVATQTVANRIRLGILALPLCTSLFLVSALLYGGFIDPAVDPEGYAEQVSSTRFTVSVFVLTLGTFFGIFGFVSLYAYLSDGWAERWALAAVILSVMGVASNLMNVGRETTYPVAGKLYLEDQRAFLEEVANSIRWVDLFILINGRLLLLVGLVLFGVAIWRSGALSPGVAIIWVAAAVLFPVGAGLGVLGDIIDYALFTIAGCWIAWTIWRQPAAEVAGAEARPRVR